MLVSSVDWNDYLGRIAIGRVEQGIIKTNQEILLVDQHGKQKSKARATKLFTFHGLKREPVESAAAGDIFALAGYDAVEIGDNLTHLSDPSPLTYSNIDIPTMAIYFWVYNSTVTYRELVDV